MNDLPNTPEARGQRFGDFLAALVAELEPLHRRQGEAVWRANVSGEQAHVEESARLEAELRRLFARSDAHRLLVGLQEAGGVPEPMDARQLDLLVDLHRAHQIPPATIDRMVALEKSLETRFNRFRATLDGRTVSDNALREVLRTSTDETERRRAWEASKQIGGEVADELLELVRLRNAAAADLGYSSYYTMMIELDELREDELFALLERIEAGTRPLFRDYKARLDEALARRFGTRVETLAPWHYADPFFQEAPPAEVSLDPWFAERSLPDLTRTFFAAVGFDLDDLLARADLFERPGKSQHAFCLSVDRGDDIRVLCNVRPNEVWMSTMLHEFGHAVYDQGIDRRLPFVLRVPAHTLTTEAIAMLFGRLSKHAAWLTRYAGMEPAEARRAGEAIGRAIRDQLLVQTRWCLVMCHMERALYRDPTQDLGALWWDLVERFQWVKRPAGRAAPDWASKIHFSVAPVYYHNYLLGEIVASQIQSHLQREVVGDGPDGWDRYVASPAVGAWLSERLFRPGKSIDWREAVRRASGRPLAPEAFVAELAGGKPAPDLG